MKEEDRKALEGLLFDKDWPNCLQEWMPRANIFDVLRLSRVEIRHSNMLAWLLDPIGSHGFGAEFLERFVRRVCQVPCVEARLEFLSYNWSEAKVTREWKGKNEDEDGQPDVLIELRAEDNTLFVIAIENKIDADDSPGQLGRYRRIVQDTFSDDDVKHLLFVYLTPEGEDPVYEEENELSEWICLSYREICGLIDEVLSLNLASPSNVLALIQDYQSLIRREIMVDEELKEICNKIYRKHQKAFELVFANADTARTCAIEIMKKWLDEKCKAQNGVLLRGPKGAHSKLSFTTQRMNKIFSGGHSSADQGSWGTGDVYYYYYEFERNSQDISLYIEFGPQDVSQKLYDSMERMAQIIAPTKSLKGGKFRRLFSLPVYSIADEFDGNDARFEPALETALQKMMDQEKKWIKNYNKKD